MDLPFPMGPDRESPLPDDLESAREEILRLRRALISDRDRLGKMAERRAGDNRAAAGTQRVLREEISALKHLLETSTGPGTPTARWEFLLTELETRFPDPEPYHSDRMPEEHYLAKIDQMMAFNAVHGGEWCLQNRAAGRGPCGACSVCVKEYRDRLPEDMKECTIVFKECPLGHGWLTATNWVPHGCPTCERDALRAELAKWKTEENEDGTPADSDCAHPVLCGFCRARQAERDRLREAQAKWLLSPEAAKRLDGYRELAGRCAALEAERDVATGRAAVCQQKLDDLRKMVIEMPCSEDCDTSPSDNWCECVKDPLLNLIDGT